jgi:hypothetical protein
METYGTAAWTPDVPTARLSGEVICPGSTEDQNSYRSEIAGLLLILTIVSAFTSFYHIESGSVKVACDGLSALNRVFSTASNPSIDEPCYDLLVCARQLR